MFYSEALDYIRTIEADGSDYGLERERELLDALGSPDVAYPVVHIAGTNGKGSVSAILTAVLTAAGYRVGTYNSPSVLRYNERFRIEGKPLSDDKVAEYMTVVRDVTERERAARSAVTTAEGGRAAAMKAFRPTAFEQETALALLAFREEGCDAVVLETGLGGRWDATNAVKKKILSVITKIGRDHCALLGDTLGEIAREKAAIIKGAAVTCPQEEGAAEVLYPLCRVCGEAKPLARSLAGQRFLYGGEEYATRLLGAHQLVNAALAVEAANMLREQGMRVTPQAVKEGLERAVWHARFEVLTADNIAQSPYDIVIPQGKTRQGVRKGYAGGAAVCVGGLHRHAGLAAGFVRGRIRGVLQKRDGRTRERLRRSARSRGGSACGRVRYDGSFRVADSLSRAGKKGRGRINSSTARRNAAVRSIAPQAQGRNYGRAVPAR